MKPRVFDTDITVRLFEKWLENLNRSLPDQEKENVPFLVTTTRILGFRQAIISWLATLIGFYEATFHGAPAPQDQPDEMLDEWIKRAEIMFKKMVKQK